MAKLTDWQPYDGEFPEGMIGGDARKGIQNLRLLFTVEHLDSEQNEEVCVHLPSDRYYIQQEAEVLRAEDGSLSFSGKRRAKVLAWEGMEEYDDYPQPEVPEQPLSLRHILPEGGVVVRPVLSRDDDNTGFGSKPFRYSGDPSGKETIDIIREQLGDAGFIAYCRGCVIKYRSRVGRKGDDPQKDVEKALFYQQMADHVSMGAPDPRSYREAAAQEHLPFPSITTEG